MNTFYNHETMSNRRANDGHTHIRLTELSDVSVSDPPGGLSFLMYDTATGKYIETSNTVQGATLGLISDVAIDTPADAQVLSYSTGSGLWENKTGPHMGYGYSGVTTVSGADEFFLASRGTDHTAPAIAVPDISTRYLAKGEATNCALVHDTLTGDATTKIKLFVNSVEVGEFAFSGASGISVLSGLTIAPADVLEIAWNSVSGGQDPGNGVYELTCYNV